MPGHHTAFEAIGTRWYVETGDAISGRLWARLKQSLQQRIDEFDASYSRFRSDSLVRRMAEHPGTYALPADAYPLLQLYQKLYQLTDGAVTPLIGQTLSDAGYDTDYSFHAKALRPPPVWEDTLDYTRSSITLRQPALLDFGAAGKGHLVDIVSDILQAAALQDYVINAGGDILHHSADNRTIDVGLENPQDTSEAIGIVKLGNASLCASAGSKRAWGNVHHIIDPQALTSPHAVLATWVMARDTMTADGLATALFFTDPAQLIDHFAFDYAILSKGMQLTYSARFPADVFGTDNHA